MDNSNHAPGDSKKIPAPESQDGASASAETPYGSEAAATHSQPEVSPVSALYQKFSKQPTGRRTPVLNPGPGMPYGSPPPPAASQHGTLIPQKRARSPMTGNEGSGAPPPAKKIYPTPLPRMMPPYYVPNPIPHGGRPPSANAWNAPGPRTGPPKRSKAKPQRKVSKSQKQQQQQQQGPPTRLRRSPPPVPDPAGEYAPQLLLQRKREMDSIPVMPLRPHVIGGLRDQIEKFKQCNCKRSNCLKLYCDCFQSAIYCTSVCRCQDCKNNIDYSSDRNHAVEYLLHKNHNAFRPRLSMLSTGTGTSNLSPYRFLTSTPAKNGCNCKKSRCLKKYCECFHASILCTVSCKCLDCQNVEGNAERTRLMARRRRKAKAKATTAATVQEQSRLMGRMAMMGDQNRVSAGAGGGKKPTPAPVSSALPTDLPNVEATAALATEAAAEGVDVFLPPSSYATPMKIPGSTNPWGALAFGKVGEQEIPSKPLSAPGLTYHRQPRRPEQESPVRRYVVPVTELERNWGLELSRLEATFDSMHWILIGKEPGGIRRHAPDRCAKARTNYATRNRLADFHKLVDAVKTAETRAKDWLDNKPKSNADTNDAKDSDGTWGDEEKAASEKDRKQSILSSGEKAQLLCTEELAGLTSEKPLSDYAVKQLTILCAQDTSLLRKLTGIIRQKTLEFTTERIRLVTTAQEKQDMTDVTVATVTSTASKKKANIPAPIPIKPRPKPK